MPISSARHVVKWFLSGAFPNRYAFCTSIAENCPFVAYFCNTSPYPTPSLGTYISAFA
jgi:hypothetical protein